MPHQINREKIKAFWVRRKLNTFGLLALTLLSSLVTLLCAFFGFARTHILVIITLMLVGLCFIQGIKMRKSFRTIHMFKGRRKKK